MKSLNLKTLYQVYLSQVKMFSLIWHMKKNKGIVMELIYRTKIHRPNKYERFHNEYYQKGDIVENILFLAHEYQDRLERWN